MKLTGVLDSELYIPVKIELAQQKVTHSFGFKKELFKEKMEMELLLIQIQINKIDKCGHLELKS